MIFFPEDGDEHLIKFLSIVLKLSCIAVASELHDEFMGCKIVFVDILGEYGRKLADVCVVIAEEEGKVSGEVCAIH